MDIVGNGFIASHLEAIADRHPDTVAFAAGVSSTQCVAPEEYAREMALLRATVTECLRTSRRLLYFSTASAEMYGAAHCRGREDDRPAMRSPYGRHKATVESYLESTPGLDYLVVRMAHLVGPGQPSHQLVPTLASQVGFGEARLHRGAHRDLIAVTDAVEIVDSLLGTAARRDVVNVATGVPVPIEQIVAYLEHRLDVAARWRYVMVATDYPISVDKLRRLVPRMARFGFGPTYYQRAIDSYLDAPVAIRPGAGDPSRRPV
ncbi:NAD-dependent epimerase/dehydratase family protein [Micromonospora sp. CPCC 205371]|nr:NAD-dependent epimerase/dehydratase family protein [Micromonospora sp. CPCC 205371]